MIQYIKKNLKGFTEFFVAWFGKTTVGVHVFEQVLKAAMRATDLVKHGQLELVFAVPNRLNRYRAESFSSKEPETLEWIDAIPLSSVVWDIGANVGLYSCYAAKARNCQVLAFEPSVFNLELLARNIYLNKLTEKVAIVPLPLSDHLGVSTMNMTTMEWGGALSTFGQDYGWDGMKMQQIFQFRTVGLSVDGALNLLGLPQPDYIKIDVDGIEHLILSGGVEVLSKVDGVLIEINDDFQEQADRCQNYLVAAGLKLEEKRHAAVFDEAGAFGGGKVWNQIWGR